MIFMDRFYFMLGIIVWRFVFGLRDGKSKKRSGVGWWEWHILGWIVRDALIVLWIYNQRSYFFESQENAIVLGFFLMLQWLAHFLGYQIGRNKKAFKNYS